MIRAALRLSGKGTSDTYLPNFSEAIPLSGTRTLSRFECYPFTTPADLLYLLRESMVPEMIRNATN